MPVVPLGLSIYQRQDLPTVTLKNRLFEKTPANLEDQVSMPPRPRLKRFALLNGASIRGLYREGGVIGGRIIALCGGNLYRVEQAGVPGVGTATLIGAIDGTGRMSAEGAVAYVVFTAGDKPYWTDGVTRTAITMPDALTVNAVDTLDRRFLFAIPSSNRYYWTGPNDLIVDSLAFAEAESQPDVLITLKVIDDVLWLVGRLSLEAHTPTGNQDLPFERIEGRVFGIGCTARDTCQKMNVDGKDTMCWVGTDRKVYRLQPNPTRISDFSMEERLLRADPTTLYAETAVWNGHDLYLLHIPGEGSFCFDLTTGFWAEWTSYRRSLFRTNVSTSGPNAQSLMGDASSGAIYELSYDAITDHGGDPVIFEHSGMLEITGAPTRCNNLLLEVATGTATTTTEDPMVQLAISDDHGKTWLDIPAQPLQRQAQRAKRVMWTRLGMLRREQGRLFRWRMTEPVTITKAKYNEGYR